MTTASFRDPSGRVFQRDGEIYRAITAAGYSDFETAARSTSLATFVASGNLVNVTTVDAALVVGLLDGIDGPERFEHVTAHERIPFQNYPYEWSPEMLYRAAELTLEMQSKLLDEGLGLKDATPYNILYRGSQPVFVDWLSFEKRDPLDPVWLAQAQFIRTFVLPLLVNREFGIPLSQIFIAHRDGLEPEQVHAMCGPLKRWTRPFLSLATLPKLLGARGSKGDTIYSKHRSDDPEKARFILDRQLAYLRRLLEKARPDDSRTSDWAEYVGPNQHFTDRYLAAKHRFVEGSLTEFPARTALDVGCNTGYFSRIAAGSGASVLALDLDPTSVGRVWRMAAAEQLDILPLVVDMTRPSPGTGWLNAECPSFIDRVSGRFDAVIMLAVIHHMLVSERIPLDEIIRLFASVTTGTLILEFVPPSDPMFRQIARGRDVLYAYLTKDHFEAAVGKHFRIVRSERLADSERKLYLLRK
jgi:SAM-dependent methyltransferase